MKEEFVQVRWAVHGQRGQEGEDDRAVGVGKEDVRVLVVERHREGERAQLWYACERGEEVICGERACDRRLVGYEREVLEVCREDGCAWGDVSDVTERRERWGGIWGERIR